MKILFATDLHGHKKKYLKLVELSANKDLLICGADILPKHGPHIQQKEFIKDYLPDFFSKVKCHVLIDFGNDDLLAFYSDFKKTVDKFKNVHYTHLREVTIEGISFIGMHYVADYPFGLKDWCRKDTNKISDLIQYGPAVISTTDHYDKVKNRKHYIFYVIKDLFEYFTTMKSIDQELNNLPKPSCDKVIYLFHSPPQKLKLDVCADYREVGCEAVTDFIIRKQPLASLHGHIHENYYKTDIFYNTLNKTICIQPGQSGKHESLVYCTFNTDDIEGTIKRHEVKC